jgi:hypothetical protein
LDNRQPTSEPREGRRKEPSIVKRRSCPRAIPWTLPSRLSPELKGGSGQFEEAECFNGRKREVRRARQEQGRIAWLFPRKVRLLRGSRSFGLTICPRSDIIQWNPRSTGRILVKTSGQGLGEAFPGAEDGIRSTSDAGLTDQLPREKSDRPLCRDAMRTVFLVRGKRTWKSRRKPFELRACIGCGPRAAGFRRVFASGPRVSFRWPVVAGRLLKPLAVPV